MLDSKLKIKRPPNNPHMAIKDIDKEIDIYICQQQYFPILNWLKILSNSSSDENICYSFLNFLLAIIKSYKISAKNCEIIKWNVVSKIRRSNKYSRSSTYVHDDLQRNTVTLGTLHVEEQRSQYPSVFSCISSKWLTFQA